MRRNVLNTSSLTQLTQPALEVAITTVCDTGIGSR